MTVRAKTLFGFYQIIRLWCLNIFVGLHGFFVLVSIRARIMALFSDFVNKFYDSLFKYNSDIFGNYKRIVPNPAGRL